MSTPIAERINLPSGDGSRGTTQQGPRSQKKVTLTDTNDSLKTAALDSTMYTVHSNHAGFSRFHGHPGSIHCKQVSFAGANTAFAPSDVPQNAREAKKQLNEQRQKNRLGVKKEWNTSTYLPLPPKQLSRQLSVYQSEKVDYNYRAGTLFSGYKDVIFVPTNNKFEVDKERFLSPSEKTKCIRSNVSVKQETAKYYDTLQTTHPRNETKLASWNSSTTLRGSKTTDDIPSKSTRNPISEKVKTKVAKAYKNPIQRHKESLAKTRAEKKAQRESTTIQPQPTPELDEDD